MNELVFLIHILWVSIAVFAARSISYAASSALMVLFGVLGNIMVLKQMTLFNLAVTTADVYAVGVILILNFIREDFDDSHVHRAMRYSFLSLALLAIASYTQLSYQAIEHDAFAASYAHIMGFMPGLVMKSACVYWVVQYIDNQLFAWMKGKAKGRYLIGRMLLSLVFSQFLDTVLFSFWALGDIAVSIWEIIFFSTMVKIICSAIMIFYTKLYKQSLALIKKSYV